MLSTCTGVSQHLPVLVGRIFTESSVSSLGLHQAKGLVMRFSTRTGNNMDGGVAQAHAGCLHLLKRHCMASCVLVLSLLSQACIGQY